MSRALESQALRLEYSDSAEVAVRVEHLSKKYKLGSSRSHGGLLKRMGALAKRQSVQLLDAPPKPEIWALRDVSFEIRAGEVFGIIGANGSGKSTLLKILSRVTHPTGGRAILRGRFCGLLEVGTGFHPELTGRDNVYMSGAILGMRKRDIDRSFDEIVEFAGVAEFIDTPVKHYSTGMYVRLGFSVLAHMDPDILIVDEVLAVGDVRFQKKCVAKMEDVGKGGRTVILVSHDMTAIRRLCRRALILHRGEVVREGPAHDVVNHYLSQAHLKPLREWADHEPAPGNEIVRLCAVRLTTEAGAVCGTFDVRQAIVAEVEFEVLRPGHACVAELTLRNDDDVVLFVVLDRDPVWCTRPRPTGRYVSRVTIPGNLLSEGTVRMNVAIMTVDPFRLHAKVIDAVGFHIEDHGVGPSARGDVTGSWPGLLRPLLKWTTDYAPHPT